MNETTKRADKLAKYATALDKSGDEAHTAIQRAEDALFAETDRRSRRSQDRAADMASRGLRVPR